MRLHTLHAALSMLIAALVGLLTLSGCADDIAPGCDDDGDCRFGRQCISGICLGNVEENGGASPTNNAGTNNGANNDAPDGGFPDTAPPVDAAPDVSDAPDSGGPCDDDGACPPDSICVEGRCALFCSEVGDCPGDQVCSPEDPEDPGSTPVCVAPLDCSSEVVSSASSCSIEFECGEFSAVLVCEMTQDDFYCACSTSDLMQAVFLPEELVCSATDAALIDAANLRCGTRLAITR